MKYATRQKLKYAALLAAIAMSGVVIIWAFRRTFA